MKINRLLVLLQWEAEHLNLALATDVTSAAFADNSSADWGTGSLVITGAGRSRRFLLELTASGITADQLAQITLNGSTPVINSTGKLIWISVLQYQLLIMQVEIIYGQMLPTGQQEYQMMTLLK